MRNLPAFCSACSSIGHVLSACILNKTKKLSLLVREINMARILDLKSQRKLLQSLCQMAVLILLIISFM